jgi:hypothetical protein
MFCKSFGIRPFLKKKKKEASIKPFEKDLRKPLCAGILRKRFLKRKTQVETQHKSKRKALHRGKQ